MERKRIEELRVELDAERLSWGELAEIQSAADEAGIVMVEGMTAGDVLGELEETL